MLLAENSALTVGDAVGQMTGLTIGNATVGDLRIDPGSDLMLEVNGLASGWVFRWANPDSSTNHIADLQSLINAGEITFSSLNGGSYAVTSDSFYTYVSVVPVPEPSTLILAGAAGLFAGVSRWKKPIPAQPEPEPTAVGLQVERNRPQERKRLSVPCPWPRVPTSQPSRSVNSMSALPSIWPR